MSALKRIADSAPCPKSARSGHRPTLFDQVVGANEQRQRHFNSKRLGGSDVDDTNSTLVGCSTGSSAGFVPLRIRSAEKGGGRVIVGEIRALPINAPLPAGDGQA